MTLHHDFPILHGFAMKAARSKDTLARQSLRDTTSDPKLQIRKQEPYWLPIRARHLEVLRLRNELCTNYSLTDRRKVSVSIIDLATTCI